MSIDKGQKRVATDTVRVKPTTKMAIRLAVANLMLAQLGRITEDDIISAAMKVAFNKEWNTAKNAVRDQEDKS